MCRPTRRLPPLLLLPMLLIFWYFYSLYVFVSFCCLGFCLSATLLLNLVSGNKCSLLANFVRTSSAISLSTAFWWLLLLPNRCLGRVEGYFEGHAPVRVLWDLGKVKGFRDSHVPTCAFCFGIFTTLYSPYSYNQVIFWPISYCLFVFTTLLFSFWIYYCGSHPFV